MNEVELTIHHMRQSKMDSVRAELEKLLKKQNGKNDIWAQAARAELDTIRAFFVRASNNAPLP